MLEQKELIVRNIEAEVVSLLKQQAAAHGRSMEAEHREILRSSVRTGLRKRSLKQALLAMPNVADDDDFDRQPDRGRDIQL